MSKNGLTTVALVRYNRTNLSIGKLLFEYPAIECRIWTFEDIYSALKVAVFCHFYSFADI